MDKWSQLSVQNKTERMPKNASGKRWDTLLLSDALCLVLGLADPPHPTRNLGALIVRNPYYVHPHGFSQHSNCGSSSWFVPLSTPGHVAQSAELSTEVTDVLTWFVTRLNPQYLHALSRVPADILYPVIRYVSLVAHSVSYFVGAAFFLFL